MRSGADFPAFIAEMKRLGVANYDTFFSDGRTDYYGENVFKISTVAKYDDLIISESLSDEQFKKDLKAHQNGQKNYSTFCSDCAKSGIEKWTVLMEDMSCTYYDKEGNAILVEEIPAL